MEQDAIVAWMRNGHARTAALTAAVRLGVLEQLTQTPADTATVATECGITQAAARVLTRFLHSGGVLMSPTPGTYAVAPVITAEVFAGLTEAASEVAANWAAVGDAADLLRSGGAGGLAHIWAAIGPVSADASTGAAWALDTTRQGYLRCRAVSAAVELGLLTALRDGPRDAASLAAALEIDRGGVALGLDGMHRLGACERTGDKYQLGFAMSALLSTPRATSAFELAAGLAHEFWAALGALEDVARTGRLAFDLQDPAAASRYYLRLARYNSLVFPGYLRLAETVAKAVEDKVATAEATIVDVGTGSGVWAAAFARAWPSCRVRLLDRGPVLAQAKANLSRLGVASRATFGEIELVGDAFGDGTADVLILGQICHTQPEPTLPDLMRRCADALRPGGLLLLCDSVLQDSGTAPVSYLDFAIKELVATGGAILTDDAYRRLLADAGFTDVTLRRFGELDVFIGVVDPDRPHPTTRTAAPLVMP
jgi:SAM-dependent methyltransferase